MHSRRAIKGIDCKESKNKMMLSGKKIIVTGGSRGLGQAMCKAFTKYGAHVAFTYTKDQEGADRTIQQTRELGQEALPFQLSVLDSQATAQMVRQLEKEWGEITTLVNNAGKSQNLPLPLIDEEDWDLIMDVNVKGTFFTSKEVLKSMIRKKNGVILNIGSLAGMRMLESPIHYATSKAAIKGMTEAMAKEVARYQIRVFCFAPGLLEEGIGVNLPEHHLEEYLKHCALNRLGTLQEASEFVSFLISNQNTYMNGETVIMDGGL